MTSRSINPVAWPASLSQREVLSVGRIPLRPNDFVRRRIRLQGDVDVARLEAAVATSVKKHAILTASFVEADTPYLALGTNSPRLVFESPPLVWDMFDAPLVRFSLTRDTSDRDLVLTVAVAHAAMDARSMSILTREIFSAYETADGKTAPDLGATFGAWSKAEASMVASPRGERLRGFWRTRLDGVGPLPASGFASNSDRVVGARAENFQLQIDGGPATFVSTMAASESVSEFAVVSVLWKAAQKYMAMDAGGSADSPVAVLGAFPNRLSKAYDGTVGACANSVVLVSSMPTGSSFDELVREEGLGLFQAARHQDFPHAAVALDLDPSLYAVRFAADLSDIPRYMNFDMPFAGDLALPEVTELDLSILSEPSKELPRGGMRILVHKASSSWTLEGRFDPHVYSRESIERLCSAFASILSRWIREPKLTLAQLFIVTQRDEEKEAGLRAPAILPPSADEGYR